MKVELVCDYCRCAKQRTIFMLTLTSVTSRKNTCTKLVCPKCANHISRVLDSILNKRDIDETLKEIESDILEDE